MRRDKFDSGKWITKALGELLVPDIQASCYPAVLSIRPDKQLARKSQARIDGTTAFSHLLGSLLQKKNEYCPEKQ